MRGLIGDPGCKTEKIEQATLQAMHQHLRFRIPQTDVELENLGTVRRQHETGIEKPGKGRSFPLHLADSGIHHLLHDFAGLLRRQNATVTISAHASGIGSGIAVSDALVILASLKRDNFDSVADANEADLFALQELLDDQQRPESLHGFFSLWQRAGDYDTFSRSQSVRFYHERKREVLHAVKCFAMRCTLNGTGGRNSRAKKELFSEYFASFQTGGGLTWSHDRKPARGKDVDNSVHECGFRTDDGQVCVLGFRQGGIAAQGAGGWKAAGLARDARIAGRGYQLAYLLRLAKPPRKSVFAATAADNKNFQESSILPLE